jgi:hypothetical protein
LSFQVSVTDVYTGKPLTKGIATLYPVSDTLNPQKQNPYYFTNIENGFGQFEYLRKGEYIVYVITDNNDNQLYDKYSGERLGFINKPIFVPRDSISTFKLSKEDSEPIKIIDRSKYLNSYTLEFNKEPINIEHKLRKEFYTVQEKRKWTVYRLNSNQPDSISTTLTTIDSANNQSIDTVRLYFNGKKAQPRMLTQLYTVLDGASKLKLDNQFYITVKDSLLKVNNNGFQVKYDTNSYEPIIAKTKGSRICFNLKTAKKVSVIIKSKTISTVLNDTNKTDTIKISYITAEEVGSITYKLKDRSTKNFIVELTSENGLLIASKTNLATATFSNLEPGNYKIRYFIDSDKNGIHTLGNYKKKREAEEMYGYPDIIPVKANWEINDISW